jgi:nitrous oxidase accessory protein
MRPLLLLFAFLQYNLIHAGVVTVCPTCAISTLQQALNVCNPADTLLIKPGHYMSVNTTINKPLTIIGEAYPVLDAQQKDEVLIICCNQVMVKGLRICNSKIGDMKDYAGIRIFKADSVQVIDCRLDNTFFGIYVGDSKHVLIKGNKMRGANYGQSNTGNGIQLWKSDSVVIEGNYAEGHRDGIYFEFAKNCLIKNNKCEKNFRYGLHFMFSNNDTYIGNTFTNNGTGVAVMYSHGVHMYSNYFINNWGDAAYGLLLKDITNSIITGNWFSDNTVGVNMEGSNRIHFEHNNFLKNGYAVKIMANCQQDTFYLNNFSGNTFDAGTNGTLSDNVFSGNYWDKYEGYDLDKDGIGDVPYNPVSLYSVIVEKMPYAVMLLRSFAVDLLDRAEKIIPSLVPETIQDKLPKMKIIKA